MNTPSPHPSTNIKDWVATELTDLATRFLARWNEIYDDPAQPDNPKWIADNDYELRELAWSFNIYTLEHASFAKALTCYLRGDLCAILYGATFFAQANNTPKRLDPATQEEITQGAISEATSKSNATIARLLDQYLSTKDHLAAYAARLVGTHDTVVEMVCEDVTADLWDTYCYDEEEHGFFVPITSDYDPITVYLWRDLRDVTDQIASRIAQLQDATP